MYWIMTVLSENCWSSTIRSEHPWSVSVLLLDLAPHSKVTDLRALGELENTLIVVTADHGHGFVSRDPILPTNEVTQLNYLQDVYGSADTKYLKAQTTDHTKRSAGKTPVVFLLSYTKSASVGTYANSGLSGYTADPAALPNNDTVIIGAQGPHFPVNWEPRYVYAVRELFDCIVNTHQLPDIGGSQCIPGSVRSFEISAGSFP